MDSLWAELYKNQSENIRTYLDNEVIISLCKESGKYIYNFKSSEIEIIAEWCSNNLKSTWIIKNSSVIIDTEKDYNWILLGYK